MQTFKEYYEDGEHLRDKDRVALMPGGYKPPTKGHFKAFKYLLEDADSGIVIIGNKDRDGEEGLHSNMGAASEGVEARRILHFPRSTLPCGPEIYCHHEAKKG